MDLRTGVDTGCPGREVWMEGFSRAQRGEKLGVSRRRGASRKAEAETWGEGRLQRCEGSTSRRSRQVLTGHPVPQITGVTVVHPLWASSTRTTSWDPRGSSGGVLMATTHVRKQVYHPGSHEV